MDIEMIMGPFFRVQQSRDSIQDLVEEVLGMKRRTQLSLNFCVLGFLFLQFAAMKAFAVDTGPLDVGTRLLVLQQPIVQASDYDKTSVFAYGVDEELDFVGFPQMVKEKIGTWISGQTCAPGGCLKSDEEGNLVDDRFLFSAGTCSAGLRLLRVDSEGQYEVDAHDELPNSQGTPRTDGSNFIDVAASDWNGDGYPDFALLYLSKHGDDHAFYLTLVDGKPDDQGRFTCHYEDSWRWTLQSKHDGGITQGRIAAGDVDGDGVDELVLHLGNKKIDGDNYRNMLGVYDVSTGLSLGSGFTRDAGESREDWDALDVTVGDFRGNGKIEIATINSNKCDVWAKIWEVSGSSIEKTADLGDVGTLPENKDVPGYLRCVAGDLDGDGRDEFVWAGGDRHTDNGKIAVVVHTNSNEDGDLSFFKSAVQYPLISNAGHPIFDLALGYFSEGYIPSDTGYPNQMQIALAARYSDDAVDLRVMSWDGQTFSMGDATTFSVDFEDHNDYPALAAGDVLQETLALGDPEHSKVIQQLTPVVVMQAPPRHWDRIGSQDVDAFSAFSGYKTTFSLQSSSTETTQTSSQSAVSASVKAGGSAGYQFFSLVDTKLEAAYSWSSKSVEEDLSKYTQTSTMKLTAEAATDDWVYYTFQDLDIWRYPILGQAGQEVAEGVSTDQLYYQVVYPGNYTTMTSDGRDKEWYAPIHENQNLLSYPSDVEYIESYPEAGSDSILYGGPDNLICTTVGSEVSGTRSNTFTSASFEQEKDSHSVTNGFDGSLSVSGKIFGVKSGVSVSGKYDSAFTETSTNSVNLSNALGFTVAVPEGSSYLFKDGRTAGSARFNLYETAFLTGGKKSLVSAYAVDLLGSNSGSLWTDPVTSPYWRMSDPALSLPQKWELKTTTNEYGVKKTQWVLCESESTRKKLRGGFAYEADENWDYDASAPEMILAMDDPGKVVLRCRVYNYSFENCASVKVKFSYSYADPQGSGLPTDGEKVEIATVTLDEIPGWTGSGPRNWVWAEAQWETACLAREGGYWIHVEIDPEDRIAEIHDNGDEVDNNGGWFEIGLLTKATLNDLAADYMDGSIHTSVVMGESEEDLENVSLVMDDINAGEGEMTLVRAEVANRGEKPLALVHVRFYEYAGSEWRLFDEEIIPVLMAGESRSLEVPFTSSSAVSDVKVVIDPRLGEADFENNSITIVRSSGGDGCAIAPFPVALVLIPFLLVLKRQ